MPDDFWRNNRQRAAILSCLVLIIGFLTSRVLLSIGMIMLVIVALANPDLKSNAKAFFKQYDLILVTGFFMLVVISGFYSDNTGYWLERVRIKLPLLALPFAFHTLKKFYRSQLLCLLYAFLATIACGSLLSVAFLLADPKGMIEQYHQGGVLFTPINHIRFSLMVAFAIMTGIFLAVEKWYWKYRWETGMVVLITLFLFVYLHVLAVRSGLVTFYLALIAYVLHFFFTRKKYLLGALAIVLILLIPVAAYQLSPTLQRKIDYMSYDLQMYLEGHSKTAYSDTRRLQSIELGIRAGNVQPITGQGYGDVRDVIFQFYDQHYPEVDAKQRLLPHNQFVFVYACLGLIGVAWFSVMILFPLLWRKRYRNSLFLVFHVIVVASFFVEATIEGQIGTAYYIFFFLLLRNRLQD